MRFERRFVSRAMAVVATAGLVVGMTASAGQAAPKVRVTKPTLSASVTSPTNSASVTFTFHSPDATRYACTLDGKKAGCTSPKQYVGLAEGAHTFSVVGTRTGARQSLPATFGWTVDRTPPPAVTFQGVPTGPVSVAGAPDIRFIAGEANDTFRCRIDGGAAFTCLANTPGSTQTQAVTSNGIHTLTVVPTDAAGNVGPAASAGWQIDDAQPLVTITDKPGKNPSSQVTVHVTVVGASGASPVTCSLFDGATTTHPDCTALGNGANTLTVDTPTDATYTLTITATDSVNSKTGTDFATWVRDATAPAPPVLSGPAAYINNPSSTAARITWTAAGTDTYSCTVDGGTAAACATPFDPVGVGTDGVHTVTVADSSTLSDASSWSWTLDTHAPALTVVGGPGAATNAASVTFGITTTAATGTESPLEPLTCTLTVGSTVGSPGTCPADGTFGSAGSPLAAGSYRLDVVAADAAGNSATVTRRWVVDRTAPAATIRGLASLTGPITISYNEPVTGLTAGAVALTLTDTAAPVPTVRTCHNATGGTVSCAGSFRSIWLKPSAALVPGQHYTLDVTKAAVHDAAGNISAAVVRAFRGALTLEETSVAAVPSWQRVGASGAYGGSYVREHLAGAQASYPFRGSAVTWFTVTGPTQGKALVRVDGHKKAVVNDYAAATHYRVARKFGSLGRGAHVLTITVLGQKGSTAARGTFVSVDAMKVGTTLVKTPALGRTWHRFANTKLFAGHAASGDLAGETYVVVFRGTSVTWSTLTSATQGKARVYLDGVLKATVDNYSAAAKYRVARTLSSLVDRVHTLRIVVLGTHRAGAHGNNVTVDRFTIG